MGKVRGYNYDAVIGVGSDRPDCNKECDFEPIKRMITWVGYCPRKREEGDDKRGPVIEFDQIYLPYQSFRSKGIEIEDPMKICDAAPNISRRLFGTPDDRKNVRFFMNLTPEERTEAMTILELAIQGKLGKPGKQSGSPATKPGKQARTSRSCRC